jgi:uncharacterized protein (DUF362 family)
MSNKQLSRRDFLRLAALTGVLAGCRATETPAPKAAEVAPATATFVPPTATTIPPTVAAATPTPPPSATPTTRPLLPTDTPTTRPSPTPLLTPTPNLRTQRPEIIKTHPAAASAVIQTRHAGVWEGDNLLPGALDQMLDESMTRLTGLTDAQAAWKALFKPEERIAIKVGTISSSRFWTKVPLVMAVVRRLQEAGIPDENIIVYDRTWSELRGAGFTLNESGKGVAIRGTDSKYSGDWQVAEVRSRLSDLLLGCHALINMPVLKYHSIAGFTFAMKNHYGTVNGPEYLHNNVDRALPELNALEPIRARTRLVVGDALTVCTGDWSRGLKSDSIIVGFDPVAVDVIARQQLIKVQEENKVNTQRTIQYSDPWLKGATALGLGASDLKDIKLTEAKLS